MPHKPLTHEEGQAVLKSVQRILVDRGIHQPIQVRFAAALAPGLCWEWRCTPVGTTGPYTTKPLLCRPDVLALRSVSIQEQISRLFQIEAELSSENGEVTAFLSANEPNRAP